MFTDMVIHICINIQHFFLSQNETSITLAQFQFTNWPENGVTKDPRTILKVLDCVGKVQRRSAKKGPVVVHCRY